MSGKNDIKELKFEELERVLCGWGYPAYHARQIFPWVYQKEVKDFRQMTNLPFNLRRELEKNFTLSCLKLERGLRSIDGTQKFLFLLQDKNLIEAVLIPAAGRLTACLSTQAGCKFGCAFCASGSAGFKRNLCCAEIIEQALILKEQAAQQRLTHIVFMGTGEPLDNYDNTLKAARILNTQEAFNIGARRITISTCGIIPGIERLAQEKLQIELSVSLHAADEQTRSRLMPVNKKYPLKALLAACREYSRQSKRQVTFEYALIKGINADLASARGLAQVVRGLPLAKVNLIPVNPCCGGGIATPDKRGIIAFKAALAKAGVNATMRRSRGEDILAACGQLRSGYENN